MLRFAILLLAVALAAAEPVPLLFASDGGTRSADGKLTDLGPLGYHADLGKAGLVEGRNGPAVAGGADAGISVQGPLLKQLGLTFTATAWVRVDALPGEGSHWLIGKGGNTGWQIGLQSDGRLWLHGSWGGGWYHGPWSTARLPLATWVHVAAVFAKGVGSVFYLDGKPVLRADAPYAIQPVDDPVLFGRCGWRGAIDDPRLYAAALTAEQVAADRDGTLATRAATAADVPMPPWPVRARLGRFDRPQPRVGYIYPGHEAAERVGAPDAVDWPRLRTSEGQVLFADPAAQRATAVIETQLRDGGGLFRQPGDLIIEPVAHWLRPLNWRWGQQHVYTTDRTARSWGGDYEIWGFPMRIAGSLPGAVQEVVLRCGEEEIYRRSGPLDSLTLILPASLGRPYSLAVNGQPAQGLRVALQPITVGAPVDEIVPVSLAFAGVQAVLPAPRSFAQVKVWDEDVAALATPVAAAPAATPAPAGPVGHVNGLVPRSGVGTFIVAMSAGMSGGLKTAAGHIPRFTGDDAAYAACLAGQGFDRVYETLDVRSDVKQFARWQAELRARGVRLGANLAGHSHQAQLGNPNIAFYAACLPDWGVNLLRDLHLAAQRFGAADGGGFFMGADNAGYVPYWDWAPPIPNRPWGRAFLAFQQDGEATHPIGPACGRPKPHERVASERAFVDYIRRYDRTWSNYGRFATALAEIAPDLPFTIGSFGSSPGVGGRGGWPWASVPAGPIYDHFQVQTAYDWNEVLGTKPLHNLALVDRLRSGAPQRATWSIVDDFGLCHGPQTLVRDWAVALSRGLSGIGTNFLAHDSNAGGAPTENGGSGTPESIVADQRSSNVRALRQTQMAGYRAASSLAHRLGGSYALMRADATVGIVYSDLQAVSRHLDAKDPAGPHEGKTTEALLLCTMAGWPARLVTVDELARGVDPRLQALLLVGLNRFDDTWVWHAGLEAQLAVFTARGGRILRDHESVCPGDSLATGLEIAAYVKQGAPDQLPWLQARNRPLLPVLRQHLTGVPRAVATSDDDRVWIFPSRAGDCRFVTVADFAPEPGEPGTKLSVPEAAQALLAGFRNAARMVAPLRPQLAWEAGVQAWDVGDSAPLDVAAPLDLATTAVRVLVVPQRPPTQPRLTIALAGDGVVTLRADIPGCAGLPIELQVRGAGTAATVWGAVGQVVRLPLTRGDAGTWTITCRELASGLTASLTIDHAPLPAPPTVEAEIQVIGAAGLAAFAGRVDRELVVALTAAQAADPALAALAERVRTHYAAAGRRVRIGRADPSDVVLWQQPIEPLLPYPRWQSLDADVVLFGTPRDNVLLLDQARAGLLADGVGPALVHAWSPFRGLCHAVDVLGADAEALGRAVDVLLR